MNTLTNFEKQLKDTYAPSVLFDSPKDIKQLANDLKKADELYFKVYQSLSALMLLTKFGCNYHVYTHYAKACISLEQDVKAFSKLITAMMKKRNNDSGEYSAIIDFGKSYNSFDFYNDLVNSKQSQFQNEIKTMQSRNPEHVFCGLNHPTKTHIDLYKEAKQG